MTSKYFTPSRRDLLKTGSLAALAAGFGLPETTSAQVSQRSTNDPFRGLKLGITSYATRKLSLDDTIKAVKRVGLQYISLKDFHLPLKSTRDERKAVAAKIKAAGLNLVGCGVIYLKDEAETRNAFEYAKDAGITTIVASIDPPSVGLLDKFVKEYDIRVAIHNHGPEDKRFPTPDSVAEAIAKLDSRIGLCIDIGHTIRTNTDPAASIRKHAKRLYDMHLKDVTSVQQNGKNIECGRGVIDLVSVMKALLDIKYQNHVALEYEIQPDDPVPGISESIGYVKGILAGMK